MLKNFLSLCPPQENIDDHRLRGLQYYYHKKGAER